MQIIIKTKKSLPLIYMRHSFMSLLLNSDETVSIVYPTEKGEAVEERVGSYRVEKSVDEGYSYKESLHCCGNCSRKSDAIVGGFPTSSCQKNVRGVIFYDELYRVDDFKYIVPCIL